MTAPGFSHGRVIPRSLSAALSAAAAVDNSPLVNSVALGGVAPKDLDLKSYIIRLII